MESSPKKVFVTGGAGFIGTHVVHALLDRKLKVVVFDSFISGSRENVPEGVEIVEGDIRDREVLTKAMEGCSYVIHLAALVSVPESVKDPVRTHEINVQGFLNVLDAARIQQVQRVVYASSAAVYGDDPTLPKVETMTLHPLSPYAVSKAQNEEDAKMYAELYGIQSVGLRFFNVYGPGQKGNHPYASVVPRFIEALHEGRQIEVFGDGTQTRDFIHVSDIARAVVTSLVAPLQVCTVINIASGTQTSLRELLSLIEKANGNSIEWSSLPSRPGDLQDSVANVQLAKEVLGFTTTVSLEEGIQKLL